MSALGRSRIPGAGPTKTGLTGIGGHSKTSTSAEPQRSKVLDWVNQVLKTSGFQSNVDNLVQDMTDGILLPNLVQSLLHTKVPGVTASPKSEAERKRNILESLTFLENHSIDIGVVAKDVADRKPGAVNDLMRQLMLYKPTATRGGVYSTKSDVANGNSNSEDSGVRRPTGLRRPTTPTATFSSSLTPPTSRSSTNGIARTAHTPTPSSPASSGPSSPANLSPASPHKMPPNSLGVHSSQANPTNNCATSSGPNFPTNSLSLGISGSRKNLEKLSPSSRLATQSMKANDSSPTSFLEKKDPPSPGIPRPSGLKGPSPRSRKSSPVSNAQEHPSSSSNISSNLKSAGASYPASSSASSVTKSSPLKSPNPQRRVSEAGVPTYSSKQEIWNRNDRSISEVPASKLAGMRYGKKGLPQPSARQPNVMQATQSNDATRSSQMPSPKTTPPSGIAMATGGSGLASPNTGRRRNLSEGAIVKNSILLKKPSDVPGVRPEGNPVQRQPVTKATQEGGELKQSKGKLSGLSRNLFSAFGHRGVSKKRTEESGESKTLNSPQKEGPQVLGLLQSEKSLADSKESIEPKLGKSSLKSPLNSPPSSSSLSSTSSSSSSSLQVTRNVDQGTPTEEKLRVLQQSEVIPHAVKSGTALSKAETTTATTTTTTTIGVKTKSEVTSEENRKRTNSNASWKSDVSDQMEEDDLPTCPLPTASSIDTSRSCVLSNNKSHEDCPQVRSPSSSCSVKVNISSSVSQLGIGEGKGSNSSVSIATSKEGDNEGISKQISGSSKKKVSISEEDVDGGNATDELKEKFVDGILSRKKTPLKIDCLLPQQPPQQEETSDDAMTPESPQTIDLVDGERLSPDGGIGSPKSTKDENTGLSSDEKTTAATTTANLELNIDKATKELETSQFDMETGTKTPLSYHTAMPATMTTAPRVRPQLPKTFPRVSIETRYHIGGQNIPSPLVHNEQKTNLDPGSPTGMGTKLETVSSPSIGIYQSNGVRLRHQTTRHHKGTSPPCHPLGNPSISSLKSMHRLSRSVGEALDQLADLNFKDPSFSSSLSAPNHHKQALHNIVSAPSSAYASPHHTPLTTPLHTPTNPSRVLPSKDDDSESSSEEFFCGGEFQRELSASPVSSSLPASISLSTSDSHTANSRSGDMTFDSSPTGHMTSNSAFSPNSFINSTRKLSREDKGILDATGTLPRGTRVRRSFNVKSKKWKDDMQTGNEDSTVAAPQSSLEGEILHWKRVAGNLQQQLSTTKFSLDRKGKILNAYETDVATLSAKLQCVEVALETKAKESVLQHKNSAGSLDTESLCDTDEDIFREKGKKKRKGWKQTLGLKLGKKGNSELEQAQKKSDTSPHSLSIEVPQGESSGDLGKKKWSSKENLLAEITNLREQVNNLQQQNFDLKRRSASPREAIPAVSVALSPGHASSHSNSASLRSSREYELEHPLLNFVDFEEGVPVPIVLHDEFRVGMEQKCNTYLGHITVHDKTMWGDVDGKVLAIFKHHVWSIDPEEGMGLTDASICTYSFMGNWRDIGEATPPPESPLALTDRPNPHIVVYLKGVRQRCSDLLAYQLLLNVTLVDSYVDMIMKNRWLVLMGARGSFKTKMATHMARFVSNKLFGVASKYLMFSMDTEGTQVSAVLEWLQSNVDNPETYILLIDGVFECHGVEQILNTASLMQTKPYMLITIAQAHSRGSSLHSLMFRFPVRMISCSPQTEPIGHMLPRHLRKQFLEVKAQRKDGLDSVAERLIHWLPRLLDYLNGIIVKFHSAPVALGPAIFLPCPLHLSPHELENSFVSQWNHFIAPYIRGSVMAGIESHGIPFGVEWRDPKEWVLEEYPWRDSRTRDKLQGIANEDVGLGHGLRISPQASVSASMYAPSIMDPENQSMMEVQSNSS